MGNEGVNGGLEHALHHHAKLVVGEADAVVGEAVLREVVGANLLAAVAGADLLFAVLGLELVDALCLDLIEAGAEDAHSLFAIFDLRLFVLATDYCVGGQVRDADRRVGGVDRLAAGAGGAEGVDAEILGLDLDVDLFGFGEDRYGDSRRVNAALGFGGGDALDAMDAGLILELRVDVVAFDDGGDVLEAVADAGLGLGEDFDLPLVLLGEAEIHAEDLGYEERGLVAAGAGAKLEDDVLLVVGVFGQEQDFELLFNWREARLQRGQFLLGHGADVRIGFGEHGFGFRDTFLDLAVLAEFFDRGFHVAVLLGDGLELLLVLNQCWVGHLAAEIFIAGFELVEAVEHNYSSG